LSKLLPATEPEISVPFADIPFENWIPEKQLCLW
jgi:hypothetical protein